MKKIKIGILIKEFDRLSNWELRIINKIIEDEFLELSLLIKDGRKKPKNHKSFFYKFKRLFNSANFFGNILFKFQYFIEKEIFKNRFPNYKNHLKNRLNNIPSINLYPLKKGYSDIFNKSDYNLIKGYDLDIILRHEFGIIKGPILNSAKYGIWSFHHGDNSINRGKPVAFWEIIENKSTIGVTLQQLTSELDGGLIIDKAFFNRHWSVFKSTNQVFEASVSLLFKNINKIKGGVYEPKKSMVYYNRLYRLPSFYYTSKYLLKFYSKILNIFFNQIAFIFFGIRNNCWTIFIGKGDFLNASLFRLDPIKLPKNEFWADPFIFDYKNEKYVFFENYEYDIKKGKISCGVIKNNKLINIKDVLNLDYHLSYPHIFTHNDDIFLMPESHCNNQLEIYRCKSFPDEWELYSTAFHGEKIIDPTFYEDVSGNKWLFINKIENSIIESASNELFIYKIDSLKLKNIKAHKQNPVIINSKKARNAGPIFKYNSNIYRPSQCNIDGVYGRALSINIINKLTIDEYEEKNELTVFPNFKKGLVSMHHLHQSDNYFVFDAAYKSKF